MHSRLFPPALIPVFPRVFPHPGLHLVDFTRGIGLFRTYTNYGVHTTTTTLTESSPPEVDFGAIHDVHLGTLTITPPHPSSVLKLMHAARPDQSGDLQFSVNFRKILSLTALFRILSTM